MEKHIVARVCILLTILFNLTLICADETENVESLNSTIKLTTSTATLSENVTETLEPTQNSALPVNTSNNNALPIKNTESESIKVDIKPSDEIIIGNFNNYDITNTQRPGVALINDSTNTITHRNATQTTTLNPQRTRKTDSMVSVTQSGPTSNIKSTLLIDVIAKTTSLTSSTEQKSNVILNTSPVASKTDTLDPEKAGKSSRTTDPTTIVMTYVHSSAGHTPSPQTKVFMHHIPFRHHLQLVPMEDEPFGAALLKDQRYIVSVLIPVGVGIIGAVVIMVTVYGLRQMAAKHGREFPRVDIEAGRQNIASISSERTDKMLLLDDDEDNEF